MSVNHSSGIPHQIRIHEERCALAWCVLFPGWWLINDTTVQSLNKQIFWLWVETNWIHLNLIIPSQPQKKCAIVSLNFPQNFFNATLKM
jgi:hypothetical protein